MVVVVLSGSEFEVEHSASRVPFQISVVRVLSLAHNFIISSSRTHPNIHLPLMHGLYGNNIHLSAAAALCQQIVPHFTSQLHDTNLICFSFTLVATIPCWANKSMARERRDWQTLPKLFYFPRTLLFPELIFHFLLFLLSARRMRPGLHFKLSPPCL